MGLLDKILHREAYSISLNDDGSTFLYREGGRSVRVSGETMADGYALYASSIQQWDCTPDKVIGDAERQRILTNIRSYYVERGKIVYLA